jgi:hypothetical protein
MRRREFLVVTAAGLLAGRISGGASAGSDSAQSTPGPEGTLVFPLPLSASMREGRFQIGDDVVIITASDSSIDELSVARALRDDVADWFGLILPITSGSALPPR